MQTKMLRPPQDLRDNVDAAEYMDKYFAAIREGRGAPSVGGVPRMGASSGGACAPRHTSLARDVPCTSAPGCDQPAECGGDILGFHSFGVAGFPFAGAVAGTVAASPDLQVNSGHACTYKARKFFFEARDMANNFVVSPALLLSAVVAGEQQLTSSDVANGITNSVFALTCEPLPVAWRRFTNTTQQNLILRVGSYTGVAETLHIAGVMWGDGLGE